MTETELERAEKRYAQAKARLQSLKNREATRQRKLDTRRKVILRGALLDLAERDSSAAAMLDRLVRNLTREQDRKASRTGVDRPPPPMLPTTRPPPLPPVRTMPQMMTAGPDAGLVPHF